jgi:hypothetical protein
MSILNAIKEVKRDNNNLQDMALLPQYLIMQMAQRGEIQKELVPLIISKKAEIIEANARNQALVNSGQTPPTIMEQDMMEIAQAENPAPAPQMMPQEMGMPQPMPQGMPQLPEEVGIAQNPVPPMQMAGGGIIAFAPGGDVDNDDDDTDESYEDYLDELQRARLESMILNTYQDTDTGGAGIAYAEPIPQTPAVGIKAVSKDKEEKGPDDLVKRLQAQIMAKESGGRRYDKEGNLLTSSKGALGEMQVMPYTSRDPGFGIKPASSSDPNELRRVGDEYAAAMYKRYGDPKLAMIAYNMGPGATDKWLAAGADLRKLPKETQGYIRGVSLAGGGEVKRFQDGGTMGGFGDENYDMDALRVQEAETARKRKEAEDRYEFLQRTAPGIAARMTPPVPSETRPVVGYEAKGRQSGATEENIGKFLKDRAETNVASAAPAVTEAAPMSAQDKLFAQMQDAFTKREARLEAARKQDPYLAMLAAGLGMVGGTSPYALTNIGQGGAQGVAQYGALQRARAGEEAGLGSLQNKMLTTAMTGELRKDLQSQANAAKYANALSSVREQRLKLEDTYTKRPEYIDLGMLQTYALRLSKNPADKEAKAKYDSLIAKKQALENKIRKELPDPDPSLYGVKGTSGNVIKLT